MKLEKYLHEKSLSQYAFGKISGIPQPTIGRYISGKYSPSAKNMSKIIQATLGTVTLEDFIPASHIDQHALAVSEKDSQEG